MQYNLLQYRTNHVNDIIDDAAIRFDYLIIDCDTELNNPISSIGMTVADKIITVHHPSVKDCIWQQSMQNVNNLLNLSYKTGTYIKRLR